MPFQLKQALQVVRRCEEIDVWSRGAHAAGDGFVVVQAEEGVQPDELVHPPLRFSQFRGQRFRLTGVPAIAQDDQERATGEQLSRIETVETLK